MNQRSRDREPQFFCVSPAARGRGGRFPGEVPVFARGDSRLPAGQEGRGQRSQQVAVIDATRGSVGGGLRIKKKNHAKESRNLNVRRIGRLNQS